MHIAIIGNGRFGLLLHQHLSTHNTVNIFEEKDSSDTAAQGRLAQAELVIFAVPNNAIAAAVELWHNYISSSATVMDVGSVKELPANVLLKTFGERAIGTHPLFGPDSAGDSWVDQRMVFCQLETSDERFVECKEIFTQLGVQAFDMSPAEHDKIMARTQALVHFIGRSLNHLEDEPIATPDYANLQSMMKKVTNDTWELFVDMQNLNAFAGLERDRFVEAVTDLHDALKIDGVLSEGDNDGLTALRNEIDAIDAELVRLVSKRMQVVKQVGEYKRKHDIVVHDPQREAKLYLKMQKLSQEHNVALEVVTHIFDYLMSVSRDAQQQ